MECMIPTRFLLSCVRKTAGRPLVLVMQDPVSPAKEYQNYVARLIALLRIADVDSVRIAPVDDPRLTVFEMQFLRLVTASRCDDEARLNELLDWMFPPAQMASAKALLDELNMVADTLDVKVKADELTAMQAEPRGQATFHAPQRQHSIKTSRVRLRLVWSADTAETH